MGAGLAQREAELAAVEPRDVEPEAVPLLLLVWVLMQTPARHSRPPQQSAEVPHDAAGGEQPPVEEADWVFELHAVASKITARREANRMEDPRGPAESAPA